ncbi:hypothetical protein J2786_002093 [Chryseobacterium vietnamense]|uniref:Uncharacterized protein n=1 Tax=Chryseobacterium vietnamense TaxID=866785 RepID=A0ACC6J7F1_9FLAO|nr:hypothetical protein [Chryseobacterium vietnamense]
MELDSYLLKSNWEAITIIYLKRILIKKDRFKSSLFLYFYK